MHKMITPSKIKPYSDAVDYFKELPFYNKTSINQTSKKH